ncbi:MFS general substrate transporter [Aaosphaeria arxii CBS 175.79]|uniref:MFS general substrate transporter n=1 Tax=Aaosphaeria arxii CBS 175.79 TaxID=1450172 RepID=A0A6A5XCE4_9PLEO|nr:MFS general substrate transporter [Aaosphaeria arxii CBS 175.79]KAF2010563.1 MFS general substrate transporter [Aaosphaeria arxii CBS 175.79]
MTDKTLNTAPTDQAIAAAPAVQLDGKNTIIRSTSPDYDDPEKPIPRESTTPGVAKVERFSHVLYQSGRSGRLLLYVLAASIGLTMFAYALDQGITSNFTIIAASSFNHHAEISTVSTAAAIIRAISKPFLSKLSDITSRPTCYVLVLVFYIIGFVVAATCHDIAAYTVGIAFTSFGKSGLDLLGDIIVADLTPLEWRAFWSALLSAPFLVTTFVNGFIADAMIPDKWRWGLGMFAIMMPVLLIPAILTLYGVQRRADKLGVISFGEAGMARRQGLKVKGARHWMALGWQGIIDIDLAGLFLLGIGFALILLTFNLVKSADGGWNNPSMLAMIVCGFIILVIFAAYEYFVAPKPVMTKNIFNNRAFMCALAADSIGMLASSIRGLYLSSYIYVIKDWSNYAWTVFMAATTLTLCFLGPISGLIHRTTHRYKTLMVAGSVLKFLGYAIVMTTDVRSTQNTVALVLSQILVGCNSFQVIGARVGSQASVPHEDLSSVIAILSLWSTLGSSVGYSIAGSIWTTHMISNMRDELPNVPEKTIQSLYGSIKTLRTKYRFDDPIRQGAIRAYTRTNGVLFVTALVLNIIPIIASLLMPNYYLGKQQNAITNTDMAGQPVEIKERDDNKELHGFFAKAKRLYYKET